MTTSTPQELAKAATARDKFSFAQTVLDRAYPEIEVPVYLDESASKKFVDIIIERAELESKISKRSVGSPEMAAEMANKLQAIEEKLDATREELKSQEYRVTVRGISRERVEALQKQAEEQFPTQYEEAVSPITGAVSRNELPNEDKDRYFMALLRHAHIVSIVAPDGAVAEPMSVDELAATWARMPLVACAKIDEAINDSAVAADFYRELVDEVF